MHSKHVFLVYDRTVLTKSSPQYSIVTLSRELTGWFVPDIRSDLAYHVIIGPLSDDRTVPKPSPMQLV